MKTQKSITFIEAPEEMGLLDMEIIRGGKQDQEGDDCNCNYKRCRYTPPAMETIEAE
jgi:hypothetical protein